MIQETNEKQARYEIITLMMEGKFEEVEALLNHYISSQVIDKSYTDFYHLILDAVRQPHETEESHAVEAPLSPSVANAA